MTATYPTVKAGEFPFGFWCMECSRQMLVGDPYQEILDGLDGLLLLCVYCDGKDL